MYGLGIKEVWEITPENHEAGSITHTTGWPMDSRTYGGSWLYHFEENLVSVGFVIGLDYTNPHLALLKRCNVLKHTRDCKSV